MFRQDDQRLKKIPLVSLFKKLGQGDFFRNVKLEFLFFLLGHKLSQSNEYIVSAIGTVWDAKDCPAE
jgi:hypothetical protein